MNEQVIDVADTIALAQRGLRAENAAVVLSAESVLSYLVLHLKHRKAPVPGGLRPHLDRLAEHVSV